MTILRWLPQYNRRLFLGDLIGGVTVAVMLVPQAMAYAVLAGLPPVYGLYASLVPLVIYPLTATSRHIALGVTAIDMIVVAAGVSVIATPGSPEYIQLVILLSLLVGALQIGFGLLRLGFVVNLLSTPVVTGFTSAAALYIAGSQIGTFVGVPMHIGGGSFAAIAAAARDAVPYTQGLPLLVGGGSLVVLLLLRRWSRRIPAALVVVAAATIIAWQLDLRSAGLATVGNVPAGLPTFSFPAVSFESISDLLPTAFTLALIQIMTIISLSRMYAGKHRYAIRGNRELISLGAANVAASFFRSPPVSGSLSRSAVGEQAGVQTPLANIIAAGVVLLTLLLITPAFEHLPMPALAAIIIVSALSLISVADWQRIVKIKAVDGALTAVTLIATLVLGLREGLLIGVGASVIAIMYRISRPNVAILGKLPGTRSFRSLARHPEAECEEDVLIIRIDASYSFANADFLRDLLLEPDGPVSEKTKAVIIDASSINDLDTTAVGVLQFVGDTLRDRGVLLLMGGVKGPVEDTLRRSGVYDHLGEEHFFLSPHRALDWYLENKR